MKRTNETEFVIVVPSFNNEPWVEKNLSSILSQNYPHFQLIYIDDASTDKTLQLAKAFIKKHRFQKSASILHNKERIGSLANLYNTIQTIHPHKVVLIVDGDDFLAHENVLQRIADEYANKAVWMTYGNFKTEPFILGRHAAELPASASIRTFPDWTIHHPLTFYAKLFHQIQKKDLLTKGQFFMTTGDIAIDLPLFEMATTKHAKFIPEILYIHNLLNPLSDFRSQMKAQLKAGALIRKKRPYKPLQTLFEKT